MALAIYTFNLDVGADWQRVIQLRDQSTNRLIGISDAVMEIRNTNRVLALRLDQASSRCVVLSDGASIQLHITAEDSLASFQWGNYPGAVQAVGISGIGRAYVYDLFATYSTGVQDRLMRGYFQVDPNITQAPQPTPSSLTVATRGA